MAESGYSAAKTDPGSASLTGLAALARAAEGPKLPPVEQWNPPFCGDIDMRIGADGTWFYQKTPIGRPALVRLFSRILRRDPERFVLVTPVERVGIIVDDAPFLAVEMLVERLDGDSFIHFRTNVDDWLRVDHDHPLRFAAGASGGIKPYVLVRGGLWALVSRAVFYDLVQLGETRPWQGTAMFGIASGPDFFPMAPAADLGGEG
jgi:hypothetical protein